LLVKASSKSSLQGDSGPEHSQALQAMVPALIESIKVAGLVLVSNTSEDPSLSENGGPASYSYRLPDGVDGVLKGNGVLRFAEAIDM